MQVIGKPSFIYRAFLKRCAINRHTSPRTNAPSVTVLDCPLNTNAVIIPPVHSGATPRVYYSRGDRGAEIGSFTPREPPVNRQPIMRPVMEKLNARYMPSGSGGRRDN
ncbi:hypothetical protein TNIN_103891 [Trichonephila inaurata madagascariensis]|uniref:Uncharacterized protein n=1 Tax=Trichonephila inaurata madagascariensis TaxID=2747483 RepID=A0A8X7CFJ1_9ARAC|nr:hypothetical protein TNIN_103891 [Trichonephila inaurata madagascariensis]